MRVGGESLAEERDVLAPLAIGERSGFVHGCPHW
jgi:hypothetical protein